MKIIELKNGSQEVAGAVAATMMSLKALDPIALYELTTKCRNPDHKLWGDTGERLTALALMQPNGRVHQTIRNVVLSAVEGDGLNLTLGNPAKPDSHNG